MSGRVVVTGIGVVSPIGIGRAAFWDSLCAGRSGLAPITRFPVPAGAPDLGGQVRGFEPREWIRGPHLRRMDWFSRMVVAASRGALADAAVDSGSIPPSDLAVVVGTQLGDISESHQHLERLYTRGPSAVSPMVFPNLVLNSAASYASMELGATGVNLTVTQGEVSGEAAIEAGFDLIRDRRAGLVLAGGGDELAAIVHDVHRRLRRLVRAGGDGTLGEGAAMMLLEPAEGARDAGRAPIAEILGAVSFSVPCGRYGVPVDPGRLAERLRTLLGSEEIDAVDLVVLSGRIRFPAPAFAARLCRGDAVGVPATLSLRDSIGDFGGAGALAVAAGCTAVCESNLPGMASGGAEVKRPVRRALCLGVARGGAASAVLVGPAAGGSGA